MIRTLAEVRHQSLPLMIEVLSKRNYWKCFSPALVSVNGIYRKEEEGGCTFNYNTLEI